MTLRSIGKISEFPLGSVRRLGDADLPEPIAIYHLPSGFYATSDTCTHEESSLADGEVDADEETVECFLHGAVFEIPTGAVRALPATESLKIYPTVVTDDELSIEV